MRKVIVAVAGFLVLLAGVLANLAEISTFVMTNESRFRDLLWPPPAAVPTQETAAPQQSSCVPGKTALNKLICEDKLEDRIELSRQQAPRQGP